MIVTTNPNVTHVIGKGPDASCQFAIKPGSINNHSVDDIYKYYHAYYFYVMNKFAILLLAVLLIVVPVCATPTITGGYPVNASSATSGGGAMINSSYQLVADMIDYYLRDTTRSLTGISIFRDVNDETLSIYGGTVAPPMGGHIQLYGGDNVAMDGGMAFRVGDAIGNGISVMWIEGRTDTPFLSLVNHQIKDLADPTADQDAVTVAYYNAHMAGGGAASDGWNISYYLLTGIRPLTGAMNANWWNLTNITTVAPGDAVNLSYLQTHIINNGSFVLVWNDSYFLTDGSRIMRGRFDAGQYNLSNITTVSQMDAVNVSYMQQSLSGLIDTDSTVTFNVTADEQLYKGQAVYISGATGINIRVSKADPTDSAKCRVVGLVTTDLALNEKGYVRRSGMLFDVDTRNTNAYINPYGEAWAAGDLLFAEKGGKMSKYRNASGRTVKAAYVTRNGNINGNLLAYPFENPVWATAASGENVTLRLGDISGQNKVMIRDYYNREVANISSLGNPVFNWSGGYGAINFSYLTVVSATNPNWDAKGYNITNVNLTPSAGTDAATKNYVDIQKANDTAYATSASVSAGIATAEAYSDSNSSRTSSVTMSRFFLANETVFSAVTTTSIYPLGHVLNTTTVLIDVICIGGGGGSGGVTGVAAQTAGSGGGGAGGYAEAWYYVTPSSRVWIGAGGGGVGGAAGNTNGADGKPSNLTVPGGTKWINCSGGAGGTGMASGTTFAGAAGGIGGGTVVMGAIGPQWINYGMNQTGMNGYRLVTLASIPGFGGSTTLGDGAIPPTTAGSGTTCPPGGYGGGAAGALSTAAVNQAGGAGCPGAIILREYASGWPAGGAK
jgi:hypothetical protein